jgi:hypothetical protein
MRGDSWRTGQLLLPSLIETKMYHSIQELRSRFELSNNLIDRRKLHDYPRKSCKICILRLITGSSAAWNVKLARARFFSFIPTGISPALS